MNKTGLVWRIPKGMLLFNAPAFSHEWVCRGDDMHCAPEEICGKSVWMIMSKNGSSFLFGHLVVEKVELEKTGNYVLTTDVRVSFRALPQKQSEWSNWKFPQGRAGLFDADNSDIETVCEILADNIKRPLAFLSKAKKKEALDIGDDSSTETVYLRLLREKCYGDLEWPHGDKITPYAALLPWSKDGITDNLRAMDDQVMYVLRNGIAKPRSLRGVITVDTALRPVVDSDLRARQFVAGDKQGSFSMDKTRDAEKTHQKIISDLRDWIVARKKIPLCSRSVDMAVHVGTLLIFEVKSANAKNFDKQGRSGIIQILEYKMCMERVERAPVISVLVMHSINSVDVEDYMRDFAKFLEVFMVFYRPLAENKFPGLEEIIKKQRKKTKRNAD